MEEPAKLVPGVASLCRDNVQHGHDDGPLGGSGYFPEALETDTTHVVLNGNKCLECDSLVSFCTGMIFQISFLREIL